MIVDFLRKGSLYYPDNCVVVDATRLISYSEMWLISKCVNVGRKAA